MSHMTTISSANLLSSGDLAKTRAPITTNDSNIDNSAASIANGNTINPAFMLNLSPVALAIMGGFNKA